jgi:PAS domain S-box-containing protein
MEEYREVRADEIVSTYFELFFPAEEIEKRTPERTLEEAALHGVATYEGWLIRKNGTRFWALMTLSAIEDENGHPRGFSNIARDLTDRKSTEEALRESVLA